MIGTFVMAIVAKQSVNAALRSAQATEKTVERMKDSLMPYFDLDIVWIDQIFLSIRNVGSGLGKIRAVTIRADIQYESIYGPTDYWAGIKRTVDIYRGKTRILDHILGSKEECSFLLKQRTDTFNPTDEQIWISSLSVYYEDVYGRTFRSRILFKWHGPKNIQVMGKEHFTDVEVPSIELSRVNSIIDLNYKEGYRPIHFIQTFHKLHMLSIQNNLKGTVINGNEFTNKNKITIKDIMFNWFNNTGKPDFLIKIDNKRPFIIFAKSADYFHHDATIKDAEEGNETKSYFEYGLMPSGNNDVLLTDSLYQLILDYVTETSNGDRNKAVQTSV